MNGLFPVCYTTNGGYIYAAAYDIREKRSQARLIVAQSKYYPNTPDQLLWEAIGEAPLGENLAQALLAYHTQTYNCAWNSETSTFALLGMDLKHVMNYKKRFGIAMTTVFSERVKVPPTKDEPLPFYQFETDFYKHSETIVEGKSVVVPVEGVAKTGGAVERATSEWVHVQLNEASNELLLRTYRHDREFLEAPQVAWRMDKYGPTAEGITSPQSGTRSYRLVAHSNNKLFVIGSTNSTGGLVVTTLPLAPRALAAKPISTAQPERYDTETVESDQGTDCNFDHYWTTASVYNNRLYVLCYPKAENGAYTSFQLFTFNGTAFEKTCSLATALLAPQSTLEHGPHLVPIPAATPAPWAYLSSNFGRQGYKIDLMGITTRGGLGGVVDIDNSLSVPFTLNLESGHLSNDIYNNSSGSAGRRIPIAAWLGGFFGLVTIILFSVRLVHRQRIRDKEARRRAAIANGMDPDMNPETVGGVTRTTYGDDASDALPMYTLRAPPLSFIVQPTDHPVPTPTTGTATAAALPTTATTTTTARHIVQGPIPTDLPPSYSPDPTRPMIDRDDTQSACTDNNRNDERSEARSEAQPTTAAIDISGTNAPPLSTTDSATIQQLSISAPNADATVATSNIEGPTEQAVIAEAPHPVASNVEEPIGVNIVEKETHSTVQPPPTAEQQPPVPSSTTAPSAIAGNGDTKTDI
ncbi:hypothetical protein BGW39_006121 [Mortierella sp. 14UC]|nr:hypothetical protein BGW39_006121 [Mortierella sp. 14UC]